MTRPVVRISDGALLVDDIPSLILGGEIHNSSSSTASAIDRSLAAVRDLGANTVLAPLAWEQVEPVEGGFDLGLLDAMIASARANGLALVPLWFGTWKNGRSTYVPEWVKTDPARFPRAATTARGPVAVVSPFCDEAMRCDARAFARVMAHLAAVDEAGTVPLVQVENEVGLLGDARDRGALADAAWARPVPPEVVSAVGAARRLAVRDEWTARGSRREGTWEELFGANEAAEEAFMAWAYARYVGEVARAGKAELDLPVFVNAWQDAAASSGGAEQTSAVDTRVAGGLRPGAYPSGGPVVRVAEIWRAVAPEIDLLAPDIYFGDFGQTCREYREVAGGLLIPEMRRDPVGVASMFEAIGDEQALGLAPFGVDSLDPASPDADTLRDGYRLLGEIPRLGLLDRPRVGFALTEASPTATRRLGGYVVDVSNTRPFGVVDPVFPAYGFVVQEADDTLLVAGRGVTLAFSSDGDLTVEILSVSELAPDGTVERHRNGDETGSGTTVRLAELRPNPPREFPIPLWEECTGVVRVRLHRHRLA